MVEYITEFLLFLLAILLHETAHYLMFLFYGIKPKVKIKLFSITQESTKVYLLKPIQYFIIIVSGVVAGSIIIPNLLYGIIYLIICGHDIFIMIQLFDYCIDKDKKDNSILKNMEIELSDIKYKLAIEGVKK